MDYHAPILLYLRARYRQVPEEDYEDLVHEILLDIKDRLYHRYSSDRGKFRAYLFGVIKNRVRDLLRRESRRQELASEESSEAGNAAELESVEFVANLLGALRRWHDRALGSGSSEQVFVLSGVLFKEQSFKSIAAEEGRPAHVVKRQFHAAREEILGDLLARQLPLRAEDKVGLDWKRLAQLLLRALKKPRRRHKVLREIASQELRQACEDWLETLSAQLDSVRRGSHLEEFRHGVEAIFLAR